MKIENGGDLIRVYFLIIFTVQLIATKKYYCTAQINAIRERAVNAPRTQMGTGSDISRENMLPYTNELSRNSTSSFNKGGYVLHRYLFIY